MIGFDIKKIEKYHLSKLLIQLEEYMVYDQISKENNNNFANMI